MASSDTQHRAAKGASLIAQQQRLLERLEKSGNTQSAKQARSLLMLLIATQLLLESRAVDPP